MWNRVRRVVAAALAAVFALLLPAAVTSAWIRGTILSTSGYVAAVTPVAASPEVRAVVEAAVVSRLDAALSHAGTARSPAARALAGPLGTWLAGLAGSAVSQFMASQAFKQRWADANRLVHSQLISVLDGDSTLVSVTGGDVVLNLPSLVNDVLSAVSGRLPTVTGGRGAALPPVTAIPASACHAATRTASPACAQIPLFPAAALAGPRHIYRILVGVTSLVPVLTALTFAVALAASPRRRTLLQLAIGSTLAVLAVMTAMTLGQSSLIDRAAPRYQAMTGVLVHALTAGFFTTATWCVAGGFTVTAIALLSVPASWRTRLRAALGRPT